MSALKNDSKEEFRAMKNNISENVKLIGKLLIKQNIAISDFYFGIENKN